MSDEKSFQYAKAMFPLFRAIVKFCSTNRLLKDIKVMREIGMPRMGGIGMDGTQSWEGLDMVNEMKEEKDCLILQYSIT